MCLIDQKCESSHRSAGSLSTCICISGILSVGVDPEQRFETTVYVHEPYFSEQTWYYALIRAPGLFWHVHIRQK